MKIVAALGYLLVVGANLWLSQRLMLRFVRNLGRGQRESIVMFLTGTVIMLLQFVSFWLLTGLFPTYLVLLLIGGSVVAALIHETLGAIGGFGLPETKEKVTALQAIWSARNKVAGVAMMAVGLLFTVGQTVGTLWIYFAHPRGSNAAVGWIALLLFIAPRLVFPPFELAALWPIITSEFIDNDVRNSNLSVQFIKMLNATIIFVYPFMLFREPMAAAVGQVPPLWLLFSIPVFFFVLLGLLPFFLGTLRFRAHSYALAHWRRQWLTDVMPILRLPQELREQALKGKLQELKDEIGRRANENPLLSLYQEYFPDEISSDETPVVEATAQIGAGIVDTAAVVSPTVVAITAEAAAQQALAELMEVNEALDYLHRGEDLSARVASDDLVGNVLQILVRYRERLVEWDISFREIRALLDLYAAMLRGRMYDISAFIEAKLKDIDADLATVKGTSRLGFGWILTALATVLAAVLKAYQGEVVALILQVIRA